MKIFKFLFVIPVITLIIIFQTSFHNRYLMASDTRDGETIFKMFVQAVMSEVDLLFLKDLNH